MKILSVLVLVMFVSCGKNNSGPSNSNGDQDCAKSEKCIPDGERRVNDANRAMNDLKVLLNNSVMRMEKLTFGGRELELDECATDDQIYMRSNGTFKLVENTPCESGDSDYEASYDVYVQGNDLILSIQDIDGEWSEAKLVSYSNTSITMRSTETAENGQTYIFDITYSVQQI